MASNMVVRNQQQDLRILLPLLLGLGVMMMISALFEMFRDKEAEEEQRKQMVASMKQGFSQAVGGVAGSLATGLNVLLLHATHFLQAAGVPVDFPVDPVTPEGVIFVAQWAFLLLAVYGVIYLVFLLATFFLKCLWWPLKVAVALACVGLILNDHSAGTDTKAFRLVCLGCVYFLLGKRLWKDRSMAARIVHLEEQVKILENRMKEMERWRRKCTILLFCLIGLLCFVVFIFVGAYTVISNLQASEFPNRGLWNDRSVGLKR